MVTTGLKVLQSPFEIYLPDTFQPFATFSAIEVAGHAFVKVRFGFEMHDRRIFDCGR
jgi:hypothetical protein